MEQNYVNVPYEEFATLAHHSELANITKNVLNDDSIPDYSKLSTLCLVFNIKKEA